MSYRTSVAVTERLMGAAAERFPSVLVGCQGRR